MQIIKPLILFIALYLFTVDTYSAVFTVTSNADAGSGTLREALTLAAANGTADKDFIYFNLPLLSGVGRTISLLSQLPKITSNLTIDGTTQPGSDFGVSDAKIKLLISYQSGYSGLIEAVSAQNIELYGLFVDKSASMVNVNQCIIMTSVKNVIIGAPGKGNLLNAGVIITNPPGTVTDPSLLSENVKISSNIFGLSEDGETLSQIATNLNFTAVKNLTFGGSSAAEGNCLNGIFNYIDYVSTTLSTGDLLIGNNRFGVNYTGTKVIVNPTNTTNVAVWGNHLTTLNIIHNQFCGSSYLNLSELSVFAKVQGNKFGTDVSGSEVLGVARQSIIIGYCHSGALIGGPAQNDKNIFSGAYTQSSGGLPGVILNIASSEIEIVNNVFRCNNTPVAYTFTPSNTNVGVPVITILSRTSSQIEGTATPGSRVDLYYSLSCTFCEPEDFFTSVIADNAGKWSYSANLLNKNIIASATYQGSTSEFTALKFTYNSGDVKIKMACPGQKGSITGVASQNANTYKWYDQQNNLVGTSADLPDVSAGKYRLVISDDYCSITSETFEVLDATILINDANLVVKTASCNLNDGSITGIKSVSGVNYTWTDAQGLLKGTFVNLFNVPSGTYFLEARLNGSSCSQTYGPVVINRANGPLVDANSIVIKASRCGFSDGAISNLHITGNNLLLSWRNSQNQEVGKSKDLLNQPAGTYILQISDGSGCQPVSSGPFIIPELNGIEINETGLVKVSASCNLDNGYISGIQITGATNYTWFNESGQIAGTTLDLNNVPPGKYKLRASNSFCTKETALFTVTALPPKVFSIVISSTSQASCGLANGSITVAASGDQPKTYKWTSTSGNVISTSATLTNAPAGSYNLYLTDDNGCENLYQKYTIAETPPLQVDQTAVLKRSDRCNLQEAAISGLKIFGGKLPYSYQWTDAAGKVIGSTLDIQNIRSGTYQLQISDATSCNTLRLPFAIQNIESEPPAPVVPSSQLCAAGKIKLQVSNPVPGKYILYDEDRTKILAESSTGSFETDVSKSSEYYVSYRLGTCESSPTKVHITVGITAENIPNKISPNGDDINDQWLIEGLQYYPNADVKIFSRSGTVVYQSKGYLRPFDGTQNGSPLPVGPYYYTIDFGTACNKLSGNLNLLR